MGNGHARKVPVKIAPSWSEDKCKTDLEGYRSMAMELGASDAKVIESSQVIVEERVQMKCSIPKCSFYGTNANCPPHSPRAGELKAILKEYSYAIFMRLILPSNVVAGEKTSAEGTTSTFRRKLYEIVSAIESQAFYDGHHLAMGFGGGPCKRTFCSNVECSALEVGKGCRHPLWARPSMESVGMDAFTMAARVGWDIYPIGKTVSPDDVPHGTFLGLVLVF